MNAHDSITIGLDLGNTFNKAVGLDAGGRVLFQEDLRNDPEAMEAFFNAHPGATERRIGMEHIKVLRISYFHAGVGQSEDWHDKEIHPGIQQVLKPVGRADRALGKP